MSTGPEPTEEQIRALEAELDRVRVEDLLLQTIVSLVNVGARKAGLAAQPGQPPPQRDLAQTKQAIDAVRALLPLVEPSLGPDVAPIRDALSQLQLAYARAAGEPAPSGPGGEPTPGGPEPASPGGEQAQGPGPAQRSGRLWVPGQ